MTIFLKLANLIKKNLHNTNGLEQSVSESNLIYFLNKYLQIKYIYIIITVK